MKTLLPVLRSLLSLYHSLVLSSSTGERTFSVKRRIKSYLRTTMTTNSLNNCMFATIHRDLMDRICWVTIQIFNPSPDHLMSHAWWHWVITLIFVTVYFKPSFEHSCKCQC